jgi:hypothetical protein
MPRSVFLYTLYNNLSAATNSGLKRKETVIQGNDSKDGISDNLSKAMAIGRLIGLYKVF